MIRRCLWCIKRTGKARYFINGEWKTSGMMTSGQLTKSLAAEFTDGMCPKCEKEAGKEIKCSHANKD